jgi:hypothetical protein
VEIKQATSLVAFHHTNDVFSVSAFIDSPAHYRGQTQAAKNDLDLQCSEITARPLINNFLCGAIHVLKVWYE